MDLRSMLNDDSGNASSPQRTPRRSPSSPRPLPSLSTNVTNTSVMSSHSPGVIQHHHQPQAVYQQQYPPIPPNASPHPAYHQRGHPASPYTPVAAAHHQGISTQRQSSHPSVASTPTSIHNQSPSAHRSSPSNTRPTSQHGGYASFPTPSSQPPTPMHAHRPPPTPLPQTLQRQSSREHVAVTPGQSHSGDALHSPHNGDRSRGSYENYAKRQVADASPPPNHYNHQQIIDVQTRRSRSISVSPKTVVTNIPQPKSASATPRTPAFDHIASQSQLALANGQQQTQQSVRAPFRLNSQSRNSQDLGVNESLFSRSEPGYSNEQPKPDQQLDDSMKPPSSRSPSNYKDQINLDGTHPTRSPGENTPMRSQGPQLKEESRTPPIMRNASHNTGLKLEIADQRSYVPEKRSMTPAESVSSNHLKRTYTPDDSVSDSKSVLPPVKRARYKEPPLWAQPSRKGTKLKKHSRERLRAIGLLVAEASPQQPVNGVLQQQPKAGPPPAPSQMQATPPFADEGPLGPWEPCFTSIIPYEEITRAISDFLFVNVVQNNALQTGIAGEVPSVNGQLEVEAKIGRIIDKRVGARLQLPVQTETLLSDDPNIGFESFMTEGQHKHYNEYLNSTCQLSLQRIGTSNRSTEAKDRVRMQYKHTREKDMFYPLPEEEIFNLPQSIKSIVAQNPHRKPKLRVTRDQSTGKVLAKIIKVRIRDIHVYSPRTLFDWRVSVNVEMDWEGDENALAVAVGGPDIASTDMPVRNKDRISYRHIYCQIDLTQVKSGADLVHELEVEIDSTAVRTQGQLAMQNKPNQYEELIKSFADNIRILTRQGVPV